MGKECSERFNLIMEGDFVGRFGAIEDAWQEILQRSLIKDLAICPTCDEKGISDGRGSVVFNADNRAETVALILREEGGLNSVPQPVEAISTNS